MYKKILIVLCIVIALFFIVPITYVLWNMQSHKEPFTVKGPHISIYLRNRTFLQNDSSSSYTLLYDIPDSEFVLDRSMIWDPNVNSRGGFSIRSKDKSILIECNANVPVKWKYNGDGGLVSEIRHTNKREIQDFDNNSTYWFQSALEFFILDEQITGKYICSSIELPELQVSVYVFGKDGKTFITNKQIEYEVEPGETMIVKCPISDPSRRIILRQLVYLHPQDPSDGIRGSNLFENVDESIILSFDPKIGFTLVPGSWNSYVCADAESQETSGLIKIYKPLRLVVTGNLVETYLTNIPLQKNTSGLRILCEATENVTLNFINFAKFRRKQVYFQNDSTPFLYSSRIILRNEYFLNFSTVECVTTKDNRVLRVWKYLKKQWSDKTFFRFDNKTKGYECCTDEGNQEIPRLTQATCYTQTECEMKRSCVKLEEKCPYPQILNQPIYEGRPGCSLAKVEKNPSGILECSYGNSTKTYLYFFHPKTGFHNFTSSDFFRKKKIPVNTMLRLEHSGTHSGNTTDMITFDCYGPKFFFANGFQWGIIKAPKSVPKRIINKSVMDSGSISELHESISLPSAEVKGKSVICYAPLIYSREWVTVTKKVVISPQKTQ